MKYSKKKKKKKVGLGIKKDMSFICWTLLKSIINQHYCNTPELPHTYTEETFV